MGGIEEERWLLLLWTNLQSSPQLRYILTNMKPTSKTKKLAHAKKKHQKNTYIPSVSGFLSHQRTATTTFFFSLSLSLSPSLFTPQIDALETQARKIPGQTTPLRSYSVRLREETTHYSIHSLHANPSRRVSDLSVSLSARTYRR